MIKTKLYKFIGIAIIVYLLIGIGIYFFQEKLLFHPVKINTETTFNFSQPFKEINLSYDSNTHINIICFLADTTTLFKGHILYLHGNKNNVTHYAKYAANFTKKGYHVWMPDYPGFGKSTGVLSEEMLYNVSTITYNLIKSQTSSDSIHIYGKSLGTGLAAYIASKKNCKQLVLETPYSSITDMFNRYCFMYPIQTIVKYKIPTISYLQKTTTPITIFEGTADWVIPNAITQKLKSSLKPTDKFYDIKGASHNNLNNYKKYHTILDSLFY